MMRLKLLVFAGLLGLISATEARADFILSINPDDLTFTGPGSHSVRVNIEHDGNGLSTLSAYTISFQNLTSIPPMPMPAGATLDSATDNLGFGGFSLVQETNTVGAFDLFTETDLTVGGSDTLFTLGFTLGSEASYEIAFNFLNANRGALFPDPPGIFDISDEFTSPTSFTLTSEAAAIPEPSSMVLLSAMGLVGMGYRRRKSRRSNVK